MAPRYFLRTKSPRVLHIYPEKIVLRYGSCRYSSPSTGSRHCVRVPVPSRRRECWPRHQASTRGRGTPTPDTRHDRRQPAAPVRHQLRHEGDAVVPPTRPEGHAAGRDLLQTQHLQIAGSPKTVGVGGVLATDREHALFLHFFQSHRIYRHTRIPLDEERLPNQRISF